MVLWAENMSWNWFLGIERETIRTMRWMRQCVQDGIRWSARRSSPPRLWGAKDLCWLRQTWILVQISIDPSWYSGGSPFQYAVYINWWSHINQPFEAHRCLEDQHDICIGTFDYRAGGFIAACSRVCLQYIRPERVWNITDATCIDAHSDTKRSTDQRFEWNVQTGHEIWWRHLPVILVVGCHITRLLFVLTTYMYVIHQRHFTSHHW